MSGNSRRYVNRLTREAALQTLELYGPAAKGGIQNGDVILKFNNQDVREMRNLPRIVADPRDRDARSDAQYGAWLCGTCLGAVGMALHHKLCHVLGGTFNLPHAETHTIVLPHAKAYNTSAAGPAMARQARHKMTPAEVFFVFIDGASQCLERPRF